MLMIYKYIIANRKIFGRKYNRVFKDSDVMSEGWRNMANLFGIIVVLYFI